MLTRGRKASQCDSQGHQSTALALLCSVSVVITSQNTNNTGQRQDLPNADANYEGETESLGKLETSVMQAVKGTLSLHTPNKQVTTRSASTAKSSPGKVPETASHPGSLAAVFSQSRGARPRRMSAVFIDLDNHR